MLALLSFVTGNPLRALTIGSLVVLCIITGGLLIEHDILEHRIAVKVSEIAIISAQKDALAKSVDSLNLEISLAKASREVLEQALISEQSRAIRSVEIQKEIENAPASSDGPVAPVLRRAIERLQ